MSKVKVDVASRSFTKEGKPFFYLADTLWMAISKLELDEWKLILEKRRSQRFTVIQISVLPIAHDNSEDMDALEPFLRNADGSYNFDSINEEYFDKASEMLDASLAYGLVPCLHLVWVNYVPETWGARLSPATVMPINAMKKYVAYAVKRFMQYDCIYSISGDTRFESENVTNYYIEGLKIVRELDPEAIITMHLAPHAVVPDVISKSGLLDFYSYQSGHHFEEQANTYEFAEFYRNMPGNMPVINTEPCYDGHGHGHKYGRFTAFDVRKADWMSLLSGAHAGITYGAHGLWSMHRRGQTFNNVKFSGQPMDWRTALEFEGAWETSFCRAIFERFNLFDIEPLPCPMGNPMIRMAATPGKVTVVIYVPYGLDIELDFSLKGYHVSLIDMEHRRERFAETIHTQKGTLLSMPEVLSDVLYVAKKG